MNAWKSPLLLAGIFVILIAAGALIAPYFIDWGNYRGQFEKYGRQLTGRHTTVVGDISVRLFPWPRMIIKDVRVDNPPGAIVKELFRADEIDVRLRLAPLLSGKLEVEGLEINRPVIGLERLANGRASWTLEPQIGMGEVFGAEDVAVSGISITNGTIVLADGQRKGEAQLDGFNAFITARSLNGPWKLRGEAVVEDQGLSISLNTGKWRKGQPLKFGLRLAPMEQAGLTYTFDGESSTGDKHEITGKLKIIPTASKKGKEDAQADFRPVVFRSDIKADFEQVKFTKIELAPKNAVDVRTFVTGDALVKFGSVLRVDTNLNALSFDVDSVLGNRGRKTLRSMRSLESLAGFVESLPENIHLHGAVDFRSIVVADEVLDGFKIDVDVIESTLKINRLDVALPGQTKAIFKGSLLAGVKHPQLIGDIKLDMISLKAFSKWLGEDYKREIEKKWSGSRGRFTLASKVDLSGQHFRLKDGAFSLDDAKGTLDLSLTSGKESALSIQVNSNVLDVDRYAVEGLLEPASKAEFPEIFVKSLSGFLGEHDLNIVLKTALLKMNGVEARDVAVDFNANENAVDFRRFKLGNVGNAHVDLSGLVKFSDENINGSIDGSIKANDPTKLVKLFGAGSASKEWVKVISPLALKVTGRASAGDKEMDGSLRVSGSAGKTSLTGNGKFTGVLSKWQQGKIHLSGKMAGKSAKNLLRIFGVEADSGKDGPGKMAVTATGKLSEGVASSADLEAFGVQSQFSGRVTLSDKGPQADGRLAVLIENTDNLFGVLGLVPGDASPIGKVFSGEGVLKLSTRGIDLKDINGTAGGTSFKGSLAIDLKSDQPAVTAKIKTGRLSVPFILGSALLGRDGKRHNAATRFSDTALGALKVNAEIFADKLFLWPRLDLKSGRLSLKRDKRDIKIVTSGERIAGQKIIVLLDAKVGEQLTRLSGTVNGIMPMADVLATNDSTAVKGVIYGNILIAGEFAGNGRTPGGLLASLGGKGSYEVSEGIVKNISPEKFAKDLPQAETAKDIETMIATNLRAGDMAFGGGKGLIKLETGVMQFMPLALKGDGAHGSLRAIYEIGNGLADVSIRLKLDQTNEVSNKVPGFEIAYAGPPDALAPSSDFTALKSHLTVAALNRTLDKLEALEEEQRRLVEEEKKARAEAEAKRKAQQKKQRLLREKQRRLLLEATQRKERKERQKREAERKARAAEKAKAAKKRLKELTELPPVIEVPAPVTIPNNVPNSSPSRVPVRAPVSVEPVPSIRKTVNPQVRVIKIPPLQVIPKPKRKKKPKPIGNWQNSRTVEDAN